MRSGCDGFRVLAILHAEARQPEKHADDSCRLPREFELIII